MDGNGKLSDDNLKKMEAVHSNGQPAYDIIIIESEGDENKVGLETNIRDGPLEEHKEHECGKMDNGVHGEASTSTEDDSESDTYEFFLWESENERTSESDAEEKDIEVPLPEEEVEELVAEFLDVESKAAQAQESLEKESLEKIEAEVRLELSERLQGDALELAVSIEMEQFKKEWSTELDDLEIRSAVLLEQLDAAGIELPSLYKSIESQVPNVCETEAWKNRTHWAGSQVPEEANQSIRKADEYLQSCRPVRRKHGRLLEEGASGFLAGKVPVGDDGSVQCHEKSWSSFNELIKSKECAKGSFGSSNWASVYLASTPQEAATLGLQFPGVDEVEEIAEVEGSVDDINGIDEIELSEEQRRKYRKVREEDDAKTTKRLRRHMDKRIRGWYKENFGLASSSNGCYELPLLSDNGVLGASSGLPESEKHKTDKNEVSVEVLKRTHEDDVELDHKRSKTVIIEIDDDMQIDSKPALCMQDSKHNSAEVEKVVDIIDLDLDLVPSQSPKLGDKDLPKSFTCTICTEMLNASEVHRHPVLDVAVCGSCRFLVIEKSRLEDPVSGGYCTWCVQCEQLQSCSSCKMLFCTNCLSKNFGEECLSEAKVTGWQCCCCQPSQLEHLISECDKALSGVESSDLESDYTSGTESNGPVRKQKRKKRIRRIMDDTELGEETKLKIAMEKARQEHLKSMHEQSASKLRSNNIGTFSGALPEVFLEDAGDGHIVNVAREEDEEPVRIPSSISAKLKPHQVSGIRFMWENVIQSVRTVKSGDKGFGCILAHNMGLGKTFQVITFLYTVMRCAQLGLRTALIVTPVNVLHNWRKEFAKWRPAELKPLRVYMLEDVARVKRLYLLNKWRAKGGVLLIGYSSFRNLSLGRHVREKNTADEISNALQCGPDILVCDEAHMIKNRRADITHALKQVRTQRRIALTGSPLQNNLMEYYCMVDFVREGFLGSSHEFRNRFQNPIENGQHTNSTSDDVKIMNQRSHILYEQLKGFVQRMDMNVVKNDLPPKKVFVITVKLSQLQRKLYRRFLDVHGFSNSVSSEKSFQHSGFFAKYQKLAQIWNHPGLLQMAKEQRGNVRREDAVENFLTDESSSDDNPNTENQLPNGEKQKSRTDQQSKKSDCVNEESNWWENLLDDNTYKEADYSGKMVLLLDILSTCYELGDKALVFSQSLTTLDLVEFYLSKLQIKGKGKYWKQGKDWYRLDGSTPSSERQNLVERFNDPANTRVKCTLISTRAGSLGINLHAANRVVLLDGSWNPTHDLQAIYRVWRYGQTKPVYAYRLMAHGTMEEKIYKRQVTKEGLAARVVDRQQVSRTISKEEMLHLFEFGDEELLDQSGNDSTIIDRTKVGMEKLSTSNTSETTELIPVDRLMLNLLRDHSRWIAGYHEHEALLQENEDERLTKEDQICAYRTAICKAKRGGFKDTLPEDLLVPLFKALVDKTKLNPSEVGDIVVGTVLAPGSQRAIECRMAALYAGFPDTVPLKTVNRQCSSGLQAVADVAAAIKAGMYDIGIAAGLESMTVNQVRLDGQVNPKVELFAQARDCLLPMGLTSENVAQRFGITRLEQDQAAVESHRKAAAAAAAGKFKEEIVPVHTKIVDPKTGAEKEIVVSADDGIRPGTTLAVLSKLKPAFSKDGTTTAGNASQVSDGAGAVLLMRRDVATQKGLPILGVFRSFAAVGVDPAVMGVGPAVAIPAAVKAAGLQIDDVDLFEINEAFASQFVYCSKKLELDPAKVNVNGGAMALGHPLGATGARCVSTLLNEMKRRGKDCRFGVISMCIGSGMGAAAVFERGDSVDELANSRGMPSLNWLSKDAV